MSALRPIAPVHAGARITTRRARALTATATLLLLSACMMAEQSANVNQSRIWTDYELHYDANADVTVARAEFRFGGAYGTPLDLTSPSEVRFDGQPLARTVQPGTGLVRYERTFAGEVTSGTFRFVDTEDEAYSNAVTLRSVEFPGALGPIDNDDAFAFEWMGAALAPSEDVTVTLVRLGTGGAALGVFPQREDGARGVVMDGVQLRNVSPGEVRLRMERTWNGTPGRAPDAGGRMTLKWTAREVAATVVE